MVTLVAVILLVLAAILAVIVALTTQDRDGKTFALIIAGTFVLCAIVVFIGGLISRV